MTVAFYQNYRYGILRAVIALLLGIFLISNPATTIYTLVWMLAALLLAIGAVSVYYALQQKNAPGHTPLFGVNGVVSIIFGTLMVVFPRFFSGIFIYALAIVLLLAALGQLIALFPLRRHIPVPFYMFVVPCLLLLFSVLLLFKPFKTVETLFTASGILFAVYAANEALQAYRLFKAKQ